MKKLFVIAASVAILSACSSKPTIAPVTINTGDFAAAPITLDLPSDWQKPDVESTARLSKQKGHGDFVIEPLKMENCKIDVNVLKESTLANADYQGAKITETQTLKNGVYIKLSKPAASGSEEEKDFVALVQAKGQCYMIHNNQYYDTKYEAWEAEKTIIESIR